MRSEEDFFSCLEGACVCDGGEGCEEEAADYERAATAVRDGGVGHSLSLATIYDCLVLW